MRHKVPGTRKIASNGSPIGNAVVYDDNCEMIITFWERNLFYLDENEMLFLTDLRLEEYFGVKFATTWLTMYMKNPAPLVEKISKQREKPLYI